MQEKCNTGGKHGLAYKAVKKFGKERRKTQPVIKYKTGQQIFESHEAMIWKQYIQDLQCNREEEMF